MTIYALVRNYIKLIRVMKEKNLNLLHLFYLAQLMYTVASSFNEELCAKIGQIEFIAAKQ